MDINLSSNRNCASSVRVTGMFYNLFEIGCHPGVGGTELNAVSNFTF